MTGGGVEARPVAPQAIPALLRAEGQPLFALLDAARDKAILPILQGSGEEHRSLLSGRRGEHLAAVAPYLVRLPPESPLLDTLIERGWGKSWGFFLSSDRPFDEVRRHLRRFLVVETEAGQALHFRFYDPRVVRPYLASCTPEESAWFFGPIRALWVEERPPSQRLLGFSPPPPPERPMARGLPLVRDAQLAAFSQELVENFIERMAEHLQAHHAERLAQWGPAADDLRATLRAAVERAEGYGLHGEREIERFIDFMARLGPAYDREPPWSEILRRGDLGPRKKIQRIERQLADARRTA